MSSLRISADHIMRSAKMHLPKSDFISLLKLLSEWYLGLTSKAVTEYTIINNVKRIDFELGQDFELYFEFANKWHR